MPMDLLEILLRGAFLLTALIFLVRLNGLRTFSKMSSFDFAVTVATGSILAAGVTTADKPVWIYAAGFTALIGTQALIAIARRRFSAVEDIADNCPLMIMENGEVLEHNLIKARMTKADLMAKLREANALNMDHVRAVVLEATGDISVLHGGQQCPHVSDEILEGVRR